MKAVITEDKMITLKPFPKLMKQIEGMSKGAIILMAEYGKGIVVSSADKRPIGEYDGFGENSNWHMESFEDFEGTVTLSND
jgi:hypothetical protein